MQLTQKQTDLFWSKVDIRGEDECWLWKAGKTGDGYGLFTINHSHHYGAHRIAFLLHYGHLPVPQGLHSCDNPSCCNPKHIHEGTQKQNMEEMAQRGRRVGNVKLTISDVLRIHDADGTHREIAAREEVSYDTVASIKQHRKWKHLWS